MRAHASGKIFEIVMPNDAPGMLQDEFHPTHSSVAIGVNEVNFAGHEHVAKVRAPRRQNQSSKERDLKDQAQPASAQPKKMGRWQRKIGIEMGPPGFEPGTKGL